jgi:hypothetical protein
VHGYNPELPEASVAAQVTLLPNYPVNTPAPAISGMTH